MRSAIGSRDRTAVALEDAGGDGEAEAGAMGVCGVVLRDAEEGREEVGQGFRRDAWAGVVDAEGSLRGAGEGEGYGGDRRGVLESVADDIFDGAAEQGFVTRDDAGGRNGEGDRDTAGPAFVVGGVEEVFEERDEIDRIPGERLLLQIEACELEDLADHLIQPIEVLLHGFENVCFAATEEFQRNGDAGEW